MSALTDKLETVTPTEHDATLAKKSGIQIARAMGKTARDLRVKIEGDDAETIELPHAALRLLANILAQMAQGNAFTVIPVHAELTTQQAAEVLNVSRPFVIGLITNGKLPCRQVGTHRRILFRDIMNFKNKIDEDRMKVLDELAKEAQELNMGY
ncbi:Helix-turn-helix domain protein [Anatilimnocola aggregata]|uniref:Helix-turn-helix domain protein n=1 Tax=Anatilimnocola aggregata TaxID=2528021 RepID=A0A517YKT6_9BACT|nr:helix-turn-helix domain-containing protein [Anatilimnocola aggregata]QDU30836.1 Helix-turn-helix domain protein [Anatilimnocola aggregata]